MSFQEIDDGNIYEDVATCRTENIIDEILTEIDQRDIKVRVNLIV